LIAAPLSAIRNQPSAIDTTYDCYRQGSGPDAALIFINPKPRPALFS